ncbi:hypothetical protein [Pseudodesulfovibrio sp.]|uniref:hypothetical protein n=1 Tax=unclassified Pseudodesulfovibrio TaxID=2661612 RepID=UPI003AFFB6ED
MAYLNRHSPIRFVLGCVVVAFILYLFSQVPYGVLREERARVFGEVHTIGVVESVRSEAVPGGKMLFFVGYKYADHDGLLRRAESRVGVTLWRRFSPGDRLHVFYARSKPGLARIPGQVFSPFQAWLRRVLG